VGSPRPATPRGVREHRVIEQRLDWPASVGGFGAACHRSNRLGCRHDADRPEAFDRRNAVSQTGAGVNPLSEYRERVRVRVFSGGRDKEPLTPALSRSTGRGRKARAVLTVII
jgi:hypothetical protein